VDDSQTCRMESLILLFLVSSCKKNPTTPCTQDLTEPVIWLDVFSMSFVASATGPNPSAQTLKIKNTGQGTLNYSISNDADWLTVSDTSGTSTGQIKEHTVSVDKSSLTPKEEAYTAVITITSSEAYNSPQKVNVSLTLSEEPPPEIQVTPTELSFSAQTGGANPNQQNIYILNVGDSTLNFEVEPDSKWISVNPSSGTSKDQQKTVSVSVDISTLSEGTYNGNVIISDPAAANSPQTVTVELNLREDLPPEISIDPGSISFQATEAGANPSPAYMFVSNSGEGTLIYSIDWDANWLSVSPNSGQTKEAARKHTVSANISGLNAGSYSATITVSDPNASNNPQTVSVTLYISSIPTDNKVGISLSPSSGTTETIISFPISVKGNTSQISTFGLELHFDTTMFAFQRVNSGTLTGSWAAVSGNETTAGTITIGGFVGSGNPVPIGSLGSIAVVKLRVTCSSCSDSDTSKITINNLADDISVMTVSPSYVTFTYTE